MELLYLLIEDCYRLGKHKEVVFTGKYKFDLVEYSVDNRVLKLEIATILDFPLNFFQDNIANVTAIIGQNGTGKTSFLEFLKRLLANELYYVENFLAVFKIGDEIHVYHTLYETHTNPIEVEGMPVFLENIWNVTVSIDSFIPRVECLELKGIDFLSPHLEQISHLNKSRVIYYSGIFDLKGYPYSDGRGHIDVSTNYLIEQDSNPDNSSLPDKDVLLRHKHKNTLRQFKLINSSLLNRIEFKTPHSINVFFETVNFNIEDSRDISYGDRDIYKFFKNIINAKEYPEINKKINELGRNEIEELQLALKYKCRLDFINGLINNFFKNIDNGDFFDLNSGVKIGELNQANIFQAVEEFFKRQQLVDSEPLINLINSALQIIDSSTSEVVGDHRTSAVNAKDYTIVVELLSNYERYLGLFIPNIRFGFIDIDWRDLSSGEKAFLDLFSRLYYAKNQIVKEVQEGEKIETVYILLDEAEIGFHPEWQRKYLSTLLDFIPYLFVDPLFFEDTKVQIVIASHSPFLVSDLPKSNIVFLKKDEQTLLSVQPFLKEQTFGANIHTLYFDSFFLSNTIGEFALNKIQELISIIEEAKVNGRIDLIQKEELRKLATLIGEPLIREKLLERINDLPMELDDLLKEKNELEKRLVEINNSLVR